MNIPAILLVAALPVTVTLRDGTRLVGQTARDVLSVKLGANVVTNLPLDQVRSVTLLEDGGGHLVELGRGATLRGQVTGSGLAMNTALGPVELPWPVVEEVQVELPAGEMTWWTAAGAPGIQLTRGGEIVVSGGRAWTRQTFRAPLVVECEVMLVNRVHNGSGWLELALVAETKRRGTPERPVSVRLLYGARLKEGTQDGVVLRQMNTVQNSARRPGEPPFVLAPGAWHRVRMEVRGDVLRLDLNGRPHELGGVPLPAAPLAVELSSDATATRWRVRNLTVRGSAGPVARDGRAGRMAPQPDSIRELTDWLAGTFLGRPAL